MCYKCRVCTGTTAPKQALQKWTIQRTVVRKVNGVPNGLRQEIAREVPCCPSCLKLLESGETLEELVKHPPKPSKPTAQVVRATVARDRRAKNRR
jgi:hypothetical protein